jgi:hypothetical protein
MGESEVLEDGRLSKRIRSDGRHKLHARREQKAAVAARINGLYKTELIRKRGARRNLGDAEYATLEWVH